ARPSRRRAPRVPLHRLRRVARVAQDHGSRAHPVRVLSALLVALLLCGATARDAVAVAGRVVDDRNANGVADPGEPGLPAVVVSDGVELAVTDAAGAYRPPSSTPRTVFVVTPGDRARPSGFYRPPSAPVDFAPP